MHTRTHTSYRGAVERLKASCQWDHGRPLILLTPLNVLTPPSCFVNVTTEGLLPTSSCSSIESICRQLHPQHRKEAHRNNCLAQQQWLTKPHKWATSQASMFKTKWVSIACTTKKSKAAITALLRSPQAHFIPHATRPCMYMRWRL